MYYISASEYVLLCAQNNKKKNVNPKVGENTVLSLCYLYSTAYSTIRVWITVLKEMKRRNVEEESKRTDKSTVLHLDVNATRTQKVVALPRSLSLSLSLALSAYRPIDTHTKLHNFHSFQKKAKEFIYLSSYNLVGWFTVTSTIWIWSAVGRHQPSKQHTFDEGVARLLIDFYFSCFFIAFRSFQSHWPFDILTRWLFMRQQKQFCENLL